MGRGGTAGRSGGRECESRGSAIVADLSTSSGRVRAGQRRQQGAVRALQTGFHRVSVRWAGQGRLAVRGGGGGIAARVRGRSRRGAYRLVREGLAHVLTPFASGYGRVRARGGRNSSGGGRNRGPEGDSRPEQARRRLRTVSTRRTHMHDVRAACADLSGERNGGQSESGRDGPFPREVAHGGRSRSLLR